MFYVWPVTTGTLCDGRSSTSSACVIAKDTFLVEYELVGMNAALGAGVFCDKGEALFALIALVEIRPEAVVTSDIALATAFAIRV
jgi:hypothetical protein